MSPLFIGLKDVGLKDVSLKDVVVPYYDSRVVVCFIRLVTALTANK